SLISAHACCTISNQSHCKIVSKRVTSEYVSLSIDVRCATARYATPATVVSGASSLSTPIPCSTSHETSVTYPLVPMTANVSNGTCSLTDQSLSYAPLGNRGVASMIEFRRMLRTEPQVQSTR